MCEFPSMLPGRKPESLIFNSLFSSSSRVSCCTISLRVFTAWAIITDTALSVLSSSRKEWSAFLYLSIEMVPITLFSRMMGTHIKAMFCPVFRSFAPVLFRNNGSLSIEGTTSGFPELITDPVIPSPAL